MGAMGMGALGNPMGNPMGTPRGTPMGTPMASPMGTPMASPPMDGMAAMGGVVEPMDLMQGMGPLGAMAFPLDGRGCPTGGDGWVVCVCVFVLA